MCGDKAMPHSVQSRRTNTLRENGDLPDEKYEYTLQATAGRKDATLYIHDDGAVEGEFHWSTMGNQGYHYRLSGKQEPISAVYGWIRIHQVEDILHASTIPIKALGTELIYEYVKLSHSWFLQHPDDMLWFAGHWNEFFDLILFTSPFVLESLDSLKYATAQGILDDIQPAELQVHIDDAFIEHLTNLLVHCDKMKFTKRQVTTNSAQGIA